MKVRGGFELDMEWKDGRLAKATLRGVSNDGSPCIVRYGKSKKEIAVKTGAQETLKPSDFK
jgi:alpha-L-fucosidase 2